MAKTRSLYVCQQCGHRSSGYYGRCPECGSWGSMVETVERPASATNGRPSRQGRISTGDPKPITEITSAEISRRPVPIGEFSRVLGGGVVPGSLVLVGGDPGIGKSTLLLQCAGGLATADSTVLYVTAEESEQQVKLRAERLGIRADNLYLYSETEIDTVIDAAERLGPAAIVVDSIQTVFSSEITSAAGSVSQVRECTARLMSFAKTRDTAVFIVGHVTKEGSIAGPRVLEHMVDAVLYLEGERFHQYRILRAVKNRFGSIDEVGVFEMVESGMREVANPSEAFLQERAGNAAGSAVTVTVEGTRPILVEVQGLTADAAYGNARRTANGFELNRLQMLVAVLARRVGLSVNDQDIFVNVVGGLRVREPAADLGVAVAIASSFRERRVHPGTVVVGEIGLSGELRSVGQFERRLNEARKLGFERVIAPAALGRGLVRPPEGLELVRAATLREAIDLAVES
ncbi:MAG TPA: DNA repair protein RadA [Thermomicrobiales bacterium]|nr:DNA repair protein RadA [Thermomicrobiales bacterium]